MKNILTVGSVLTLAVIAFIVLWPNLKRSQVMIRKAPESNVVKASDRKHIISEEVAAAPAPVVSRDQPVAPQPAPTQQETRFTSRPAPSDPELARLELRRINGPAIDGRFRDMYLQLGMSQEEIERFRNLRLDRNDHSAALFRKAAKQDGAKDRESLQTVFEVVNDTVSFDYETELVKAFGEEKARLMMEFEKKPYRRP